jgi:hypothetical protein
VLLRYPLNLDVWDDDRKIYWAYGRRGWAGGKGSQGMSDSSGDNFPGWDGTMRRDGLFVSVSVEGTWVVIPYDGQSVLTTCPCCRKPFATKRAAVLTADAVYPPSPPAPRQRP